MAKVLVIDDSAWQRKRVLKILSEAGFETDEAENGKLALAKIDEEKFDCICSDLIMPVMNGFEFVQALNKNENKVPVIILTADIQETTKTQCIEYGVSDFINKPVKADDLLNALKKVC